MFNQHPFPELLTCREGIAQVLNTFIFSSLTLEVSPLLSMAFTIPGTSYKQVLTGYVWSRHPASAFRATRLLVCATFFAQRPQAHRIMLIPSHF